jgi:hypothetical protein
VKKFFRIIASLVLLVNVCNTLATAQEDSGKRISPKRENKQSLKEKARKERNIKKAEKEARKYHLSLQSKDTRKRMKKNFKMNAAKHEGKKELFIKRWFTRR